MKLSFILIAVGMLSTALSSLLFKYFNNYLNVMGFFLSLSTLIIGVIWEYETRKTAKLSLEENRTQHLDIIEAIEKYENLLITQIKKTDNLELSNSKLKQFMNQVTLNLKKEHFSKESLLERLDKPIYCLLFHKTEEVNLKDKELKPLRDTILFSLGFKFIRGSRGVYILPPSQLPLFKNRKDVEKWVREKIMRKIPRNHRYIFSFISLIDLRFTISIKRDKLTKKYDTLMGSLNAEELITFSEGLTYLQKKKNLSIKDIIEMPNLFFLSDNTSLTLEKKKILKERNEKIIGDLERRYEKEIFTTDFPEMDSKILHETIKEHLTITLEDVEIIKSNAQFWIDFFQNKIINTCNH